MATAAGVIPGILEAWPRLTGRTLDRRSTDSRERPARPAYSKSSGMDRVSFRLARAICASCRRCYPSYLSSVSCLAFSMGVVPGASYSDSRTDESGTSVRRSA
jgi:hypothetical protein